MVIKTIIVSVFSAKTLYLRIVRYCCLTLQTQRERLFWTRIPRWRV